MSGDLTGLCLYMAIEKKAWDSRPRGFKMSQNEIFRRFQRTHQKGPKWTNKRQGTFFRQKTTINEVNAKRKSTSIFRKHLRTSNNKLAKLNAKTRIKRTFVSTKQKKAQNTKGYTSCSQPLGREHNFSLSTTECHAQRKTLESTLYQ